MCSFRVWSMTALHIYHSDNSLLMLALSGHDIPGPVIRIGCRNNASFVDLFARLLAGRQRFDRIIIDCHGAPGEIFFGEDRSFHDGWFRDQRAYMGGQSFAAPGAHILFSGCNVAEGPGGWSFLTEAARCMLIGVGGQAKGWTSVGFGNPITGRVVHLTGHPRTVHVDGSGQVTRREGA